MKYVCDKSKEEIINIIVDEFNKANKVYYEFSHSISRTIIDRNEGRYAAMANLLQRLGIFESED